MKKSDENRPRQKQTNRGFVMLIVAAVLAALTALVVSQSQITISDTRNTSAVQRDAHARAVAESCLQRMLQHARTYSNDPAVSDLDALLDPDGTPNNGDEFLPTFGAAGETRVHIPPSVSDTLHQYQLIPMDGGACIARYDDNNDDYGHLSSGIVGASNVQANETTGSDEPGLDTDRSIILTAIGIYPYRLPAATAYERASARVTVRGMLVSEVNGTSTEPAILLSHDLDVNGPFGNGGDKKFHVCGNSGINIRRNVGNKQRCVCGSQVLAGAATALSACNDNNCDDPNDDYSGGSTGWLCAATNVATPNTPPVLDGPIDPKVLRYALSSGATTPRLAQRFNWAISNPTGGFTPALPLPAFLPVGNIHDWTNTQAPVPAPATAVPQVGPPMAFWGRFTDANPDGVTTINRLPFSPDGNAGGAMALAVPPNTGICSFYLRSTSSSPASTAGDIPFPGGGILESGNFVYVWDYTDTDPYTTLHVTPGSPWKTAPNATNVLTPTDNVGPNAYISTSCAGWTSNAAPFDAPEPCDWATGGAGTTRQITCNSNQSLCWKPVAKLDGGTATVVGTTGVFSSGAPEASGMDGTVEHFAIGPAAGNIGNPVPYSAAGQNWQQMCGAVADAQPDEGWFHDGTAWIFGNDEVESDDWFDRGVYFVIDNDPTQASTAVRFKEEVGSVNDRLRAAFLVKGSLYTEKHLHIVCPTCDDTVDASNTRTCVETGSLQIGPYEFDGSKSSGFAFMAGGHCELGAVSGHEIVGDMLCRTILSRANGGCLVGDAMVFGGPTGPTLPAVEPCYEGCAANGTFPHAPRDGLGSYCTSSDNNNLVVNEAPICLNQNWGVAGMMLAGDIILERTNWVRGPAMVAHDDVYLGHHNYIESTIRSVRLTNATQDDNFVTLYEHKNTISGRVISQFMSVREEQNMVNYEGGATTPGVSEQFIWMDSTW